MWFEAHEMVRFPPVLAGNRFRGALGMCLPGNLFAPLVKAGGPSGLRNPPRPFVMRARDLDGQTVRSGERFALDMNLFAPIADAVAGAFAQSQPFHGAVELVDSVVEAFELPLDSQTGEVHSACVSFLTPTELKLDEGLAATPEFPILFTRAITRIRTLSSFYADPLDLDFEYLRDLATNVRMTGHTLQHESAFRRSTRTGQTHPLGGFTGSACYEGALRALLPILEAARHAGVGRQTVWGKGEIQIKTPSIP